MMDVLKVLHSMGMGAQVDGPGRDQLLQQAQHIWSMLDDMADKDPESYKRFINKQTEEYKAMTIPPQPQMCIRTQLQGTTLYVNIMSWQRTPKSISDEYSIPLFAGPLENFKDKKNGETVWTIAVTANPEVLVKCGAQAGDAEERSRFISLTLDYVQHLCKRAVSRVYTLLPQSTQFKGDLEKAQKFFTGVLKNTMKKDRKGQEETGPTPDIDLPESMLSMLANISTSGAQTFSQSKGSSQSASADAPILFSDTRGETQPAVKKTLIQELSSKEVRLRTPQYTLDTAASKDCLVLKVELPGVTSVAQCELDISEDDLKLFVEGLYELTVQLPSRIDDTEANAKFSKKRALLTLHMPLATSR